MGTADNKEIKFLDYDNLIVSKAHSKATCNTSRTECKGGFGEYTLYWEGGKFDQVQVRDFWLYDDDDWGKPISFDGGKTWKSRGTYNISGYEYLDVVTAWSDDCCSTTVGSIRFIKDGKTTNWVKIQ